MNILKRIFLAANYPMTVAQNKVLLWKGRKKIELYHNRYAGKRCFIIGNGPSLQVEDLEKLKGEVTFGTHRIYKLFGNTSWRPSFYFAQDYKMIKENFDSISAISSKEKFIGMVSWNKYPYIRGATFSHIILKPFYPEPPEFSDDVSKEFYEGMTVTYMCLQFAVYMGFSEIYLLGVDHQYSIEMNPDGTMKKTEGVQDHFANDDICTNVPQTYKSTLSYYAARKYADLHEVKIYNATRGGKLDAFEKIEFDQLMKGISDEK